LTEVKYFQESQEVDVAFWTNSEAANAQQVIAQLWGKDVDALNVI
jgi:hypothetical protein